MKENIVATDNTDKAEEGKNIKKAPALSDAKKRWKIRMFSVADRRKENGGNSEQD